MFDLFVLPCLTFPSDICPPSFVDFLVAGPHHVRLHIVVPQRRARNSAASGISCMLLPHTALLYDDECSLHFASSRTVLTAAQGVHEVLKSAGKDVYTLRFATEQLAQDWFRAFELIAKVSGFVALFVLFCRIFRL
jgi:hypothetical protein